VAECRREHDVPGWINPNEEHMGSTIFGNAIPAMPQDKEIGRDGSSRVGIGGQT